MGRLIDADDAINIFTNRLFETLKTYLSCVTAEENQICLETCYKVAKYEIDNIPTAYDVEKVVAELEKEKEIHTEHYNISLYKDYPEVKQRYEQIQLVIDDAISKVRKGGVK